MQLDMNKYTTEFIKRQDLIREMDEKNITYDELDEDRKAIFNK
jgi:ubiquitin C-terminal hydrolase